MNKIVIDKVTSNVLKENTSSDAATFAPLILPLIEKIYTDTFISQVADTQPLSSSTGRVACLFSMYNGTDTTPNSHPDNSYICYTSPPVTALSASGMTVGTTVTEYSSSDTYKVIYIEDNKILLTIETGSHVINKGDAFNNGAFTITYSTPNRVAIKKLFKNYSGTYAYGNDSNTSLRNVSFETRTKLVETVARKIKSKFSFEQFYDLMTVYNKNGIELAAKCLATEINHEIDKEFIDYIKFIAKYTVLSTTSVKLSNSVAAYQSGAMQDITSDIAMNIFTAAEQIVRDTRRNRTIFVLADPITIAFLQVNPLLSKATSEEENPYRVGTLGTYPLFCDLFAEPNEHYVLVGYKGSNEGDGDSGIIFAPYTNTLHNVESGDMKHNLMMMNRYAIVRHPQDSGNVTTSNIWDSSNASNSDFFKMFILDYGTSIPNFTDTTLNNFE